MWACRGSTCMGLHGCASMERRPANATDLCHALVNTWSPHAFSRDPQMKENPARCSARFLMSDGRGGQPGVEYMPTRHTTVTATISMGGCDGRPLHEFLQIDGGEWITTARSTRPRPSRGPWLDAGTTWPRSVISRPYHNPVAPAGSGWPIAAGHGEADPSLRQLRRSMDERRFYRNKTK